MKKVKDIITQKNNELDRLKAKSVYALDIVTNTINSLADINEEIDIKINEIDAIKSNLNAIEIGLDNTRTNNSKIIEKFKALIEV